MSSVNSTASVLFIDRAMEAIDHLILLIELAATIYFGIAFALFIAKRHRAATPAADPSKATTDSLAKPPQSRIVLAELPAMPVEPTVDEPAAVALTVEPEALIERAAEPMVEPVIKPTVKPVVEPAAEPIAEPIAEPVIESIDPLDRALAEPVVPEPRASTPKRRSRNRATKDCATAVAATAQPAKSKKGGSRRKTP